MKTNAQRLQRMLIRDTGNDPDVPEEEEYLRKKYGEPDENGVYGARKDDDREDEK